MEILLRVLTENFQAFRIQRRFSLHVHKIVSVNYFALIYSCAYWLSGSKMNKVEIFKQMRLKSCRIWDLGL